VLDSSPPSREIFYQVDEAGLGELGKEMRTCEYRGVLHRLPFSACVAEEGDGDLRPRCTGNIAD
jgi:hypothetical protein